MTFHNLEVRISAIMTLEQTEHLSDCLKEIIIKINANITYEDIDTIVLDADHSNWVDSL